MDDKELLHASAEIFVEILADCPHCEYSNDIHHEQEVMSEAFTDNWGSDNCDIEIKCISCSEKFIVKEIKW